MSISEQTRARIEQYLDSDRVVLFMKGTPQQPQCGFSATTSGILNGLVPSYTPVNVLEDQDIREGIKVYGDWPTIPQLYVDKELVGGCDIVTAMYNSGELHDLLGLEQPDRTPPEVTITDDAAANIKQAMQGHDNMALHFSIDAGWQSQFMLQPPGGHEIQVESNGITLLMDLNTAQRARGAVIDWVDSIQGTGLKIDLPAAPPPVKALNVQALKQKLDEGETLHLYDVRSAEDRAKASLPQAVPLDQQALQAIAELDKDAPLVFICHHGNSSMGAAEHFRKQGYTNVSNVVGGIDAWSLQVDPSVPQY